jgi:hypothetical protein
LNLSQRYRQSPDAPRLVSFAVNSFSKRPFASDPVFSVLLTFLFLVNGWADRFGRRGDQRARRAKLFGSFPGEKIKAWTISPQVNSPRNNNPTILTPAE